MTKNKRIGLLSLVLGCSIFVSGCATKSFKKQGFDPEKVGRIAVLPFLDARPNPAPDNDFKYLATETTTFMLPDLKFKRHFAAFDTTDIGLVGEYSAKIIEPTPDHYAPADYIRQLGPTEAKWVLVPVCNDLSRYNVVLYAGGSATVSLYLFSKESGDLCWKGSSKQSSSMGGLMGGLAGAIDKYAFELTALLQGAQKAFNTLPQVKSGGRNVTRGGGDWLVKQYSPLNASDLQRIAVTKVVDGRRRESKNVAYEPEKLREHMLKILRDKGYDAVPVDGYGTHPMVSHAQVALADLTFGRSLAGMGAKYVLVPVADDISNPPELVGKHYELSYYLFNTETGQLAWEGSSFGRSEGKAMLALDKNDGLPKHKDLPR